MKALSGAILLMAMPGVVAASDFTPLMVLMLIPFALLALLVWAITWLPTIGLEALWLKIPLRVFGLCFIFTPTFTPGGNGRMLSVSLYDMTLSAFGADPVYARQAIVNVSIATAALSALALLLVYQNRWKPRHRGGADDEAG